MRMTLAILDGGSNCSGRIVLSHFNGWRSAFLRFHPFFFFFFLKLFLLFFLVAQIVSILLWSLIYYTLFISPLLFISDSVARPIELILDPINPTSPKWFFYFYKKNLDASRASPNGHRLEMFSVETRLE